MASNNEKLTLKFCFYQTLSVSKSFSVKTKFSVVNLVSVGSVYNSRCKLYIEVVKIKRVLKFNYFSCVVTCDGKCEKEN